MYGCEMGKGSVASENTEDDIKTVRVVCYILTVICVTGIYFSIFRGKIQ
jgi:hypothetical protein